MGTAFPAVLAAGFPCLSVLTLTHKQLFYRWHSLSYTSRREAILRASATLIVARQIQKGLSRASRLRPMARRC